MWNILHRKYRSNSYTGFFIEFFRPSLWKTQQTLNVSWLIDLFNYFVSCVLAQMFNQLLHFVSSSLLIRALCLRLLHPLLVVTDRALSRAKLPRGDGAKPSCLNPPKSLQGPHRVRVVWSAVLTRGNWYTFPVGIFARASTVAPEQCFAINAWILYALFSGFTSVDAVAGLTNSDHFST